MPEPTDHDIKERAHRLWEQAGKPRVPVELPRTPARIRRPTP